MDLNTGDQQRQKRKKWQSIVSTTVISIGVFLIVIAILASIKIPILKLYTNDRFQFSLKYPASWQVIENPLKGLGVVAFKSLKEHPLDDFYESLGITLTDLSKDPKTLKQFTALAMAGFLKPVGQNVRVLQSREFRLAGQPAHRLIFETAQPDNPLRFDVCWVIRPDTNMAYTLTYIGQKEDFQKYERLVKAMHRSFKFLKSPSD